MTTTQSDPFTTMSTMVTSHWIPQVVRAAIDLSLPEHLAGEALTADEIAQREGSAPATTYRLMRACVVIGPVDRRRPGPVPRDGAAGHAAKGSAGFVAQLCARHDIAGAVARVERILRVGARR